MNNQNVNKTCRRGHALNKKNAYYRKHDGATDCRRCAAMRKMRYRRDEGYRVLHETQSTIA